MSNMTKYALEASLKKLLLEKPLDKITINDLTEGCGISRMAFYYHFTIRPSAMNESSSGGWTGGGANEST